MAVASRSPMAGRIAGLAPREQTIVVLVAVAAGFLLIDPLVLSAVRRLDPETRQFFRFLTDLGKSGWILIPSGGAIVVLMALRSREPRLRLRAAYGYLAQLLGFLFASVAGAGLAASLTKNVLGRARPELSGEPALLEFQPFAFDADYAAFPSGHATTIFALGVVLAILWPRARAGLLAAAALIASTRFLIPAHYFSDVVAGAALGSAFPLFLRYRLAARRLLFEKNGHGAIRMRGRRLMRGCAREVRHRLRWRTESVPDSVQP